MQQNSNVLLGLEALVDFASAGCEQISFSDEVSKLQKLLEERENLRKLIEDVQTKEAQTNATVEDCKKTLLNVNAARIKVNANLKMSKTLLDTMQSLESKRKTQNMFVFGPNPIFNSAKEHELNYSITNQFVIEMLKELDISYLVAEKNLVSAKDCRKKYKENKQQIEESLQLVQETIDMQINKVNELQNSELNALKTDSKVKKLSDEAQTTSESMHEN